MSKNLTLKGAAFGALVALSISAVAPASAAGLADTSFVSLAPTTGTEYAVLAGQSFDLKSNSASAVTAVGQDLKFLVADSNAVVTAASNVNGYTASVNTTTTATAAGVVTVVTTAAKNFHTGDVVDISGITTATGGNGAVDLALLNKSGAVITVVNSTTFTYSTASALSGAITATVAGTVTYVRGARAANNSFVFNSHNASNAADRKVQLSADTTNGSVSVDVTAWVDANDNEAIDSTEYVSPTRTVKFLKSTDITPAVTLDPVTAGATSLTARIQTTPVLNGEQVGNKLGAVFTRQDSALSVAVLASSSWSDTTKTWTITKSLATTNTGGTLYGAATNGAWTDLVTAIAGAAASTTVAEKVATTTQAAHKLRVGDKVSFAASNPTLGAGTGTTTATTVTVTSVPSVNTFTWVSTVSTLAATSAAYTVETYAGNTSIVDRGFAGTYTAQAAVILAADIAQTTAQYLSKIGAAVSSAAVSKTASSVTVDAAENANVGKTGADTSDVRKGTNAADVVVTVKNADSDPVGAGVQVSATVSQAPVGSGTYKVNGTTVANGSVVYATTDASGQAKFTVNNSLGALNDSIALSFTSEAVTAATETLTWNTAVYSIVDLNDASAVASGSRDRSVVKGGTYTFNLLVRDQFKQAVGSDYRVNAAITGRTVATANYTLTAGKLALPVTDGGLGAGNFASVSLSLEKLTGTTWAAATDADVVNWDQAYSAGAVTQNAGEQRVVQVTFLDQTDAIALNANAASTPNTTTAGDLAATVTKSALAALDLRVAGGNAPSFAGTSAAGVVSGIVKNSVTAVARPGVAATATGAGLLFNVGDVWALGSISFVTDKDGFFAVNVYSVNSGDKKVTITSGAATGSTTVAFTGAATDKKVLSVAGTQKISAGSTLRADILLVDGNGNAVDTTAPAATPAAAYIKVIYDGPGLLSGSAIANETDADGKAAVRYLLGTGDKGTALVTVKYDQNYDGDFTDATDIVVSREYLISVSAKIVKAKNSVATVKNAYGASITVVRGTKSKTVIATSNSQKVTVKGGTGTVKVYVNDIKVASK